MTTEIIRLDLSLDEFKALVTNASLGVALAYSADETLVKAALVTADVKPELALAAYTQLMNLTLEGWDRLQDRIINLGKAANLHHTASGGSSDESEPS